MRINPGVTEHVIQSSLWYCSICGELLARTSVGTVPSHLPHVCKKDKEALRESGACWHLWECDPWEYGGATCSLCDARDENTRGAR